MEIGGTTNSIHLRKKCCKSYRQEPQLEFILFVLGSLMLFNNVIILNRHASTIHHMQVLDFELSWNDTIRFQINVKEGFFHGDHLVQQIMKQTCTN